RESLLFTHCLDDVKDLALHASKKLVSSVAQFSVRVLQKSFQRNLRFVDCIGPLLLHVIAEGELLVLEVLLQLQQLLLLRVDFLLARVLERLEIRKPCLPDFGGLDHLLEVDVAKLRRVRSLDLCAEHGAHQDDGGSNISPLNEHALTLLSRPTPFSECSANR